MKRQQDRQRGAFGADPRCVKAMPCRAAFPAGSDPSVGIRMLVYIALYFVSCSRIDSNSSWRFALVLSDILGIQLPTRAIVSLVRR
jgi:hypothetical protein